MNPGLLLSFPHGVELLPGTGYGHLPGHLKTPVLVYPDVPGALGDQGAGEPLFISPVLHGTDQERGVSQANELRADGHQVEIPLRFLAEVMRQGIDHIVHGLHPVHRFWVFEIVCGKGVGVPVFRVVHPRREPYADRFKVRGCPVDYRPGCAGGHEGTIEPPLQGEVIGLVMEHEVPNWVIETDERVCRCIGHLVNPVQWHFV